MVVVVDGAIDSDVKKTHVSRSPSAARSVAPSVSAAPLSPISRALTTRGEVPRLTHVDGPQRAFG